MYNNREYCDTCNGEGVYYDTHDGEHVCECDAGKDVQETRERIEKGEL